MYKINGCCVTEKEKHIHQKLEEAKVGFRYSVVKRIKDEEFVFIYKKISKVHFDFIALTLNDLIELSGTFSDDQF